MPLEALTWVGIALCVSQSAFFSGLNLAVFGVGRLHLEIAAAAGNRAATRVLHLRRRSNVVLATILWGNVGVNVLLTLLSDSMLTGLSAFVFSTAVITFLGEIIPQAYFSRHAVRMASLLSPVLNLYRVLLYPVARPTSWMLDRWLGTEGIQYFRERELLELLRRHVGAEEAAEVGAVEGTGAMNFLLLDDVPVVEEGEDVDPRSIVEIELVGDRPAFPAYEGTSSDPFLRRIQVSGKRWVVLVDHQGRPRLLLDSDAFLRAALFRPRPPSPLPFCHRPILVHDPHLRIGALLSRLEVQPIRVGDDVIDRDTILLWTPVERRIITGADILGRLLRGISVVEPLPALPSP